MWDNTNCLIKLEGRTINFLLSCNSSDFTRAISLYHTGPQANESNFHQRKHKTSIFCNTNAVSIHPGINTTGCWHFFKAKTKDVDIKRCVVGSFYVRMDTTMPPSICEGISTYTLQWKIVTILGESTKGSLKNGQHNSAIRVILLAIPDT